MCIVLSFGIVVIKKIYDQTDIAYYRNDYLAHGAMGFEDNADYREFGEKLIARISAYLTDVMQYYAQLKVTLGGMELAGCKLPENCSPDDELTLHIEGHEIPLYPYIAHNEKEGVLFFDYYSASRNNQIAKGLNYIRGGGRKSFVAPYYCEIYERHFGGEIQKISDSMNKSLERNNSTLEIEKVLNELNEADNFVRPEYIIHWVENWLNDDKGSIHLLMMERGMGKTALSYALASGKEDPGDVTVCAYYCGQSGMRGDYISGINNALTGDIVRVQNRRMSYGQSEESEDFIRLKYDAEDKHANMTETLEYFRDEHAYFHQKSKLLLIMDGVDELPRESAGLFDYIPRPEEMPDNTYILITSRNPVTEKLPAHISGAIEQLISIDTMLVSSDIQGANGENNHCVLKDYATTKVRLLDGGEMRKLSDDEAEHLIQLSGGIFLNLKLYAKLAESGIPVKSLPALDSQPLFERYLKEIQKYYGDKLFDEAMTVLYAIVTAEEPLTLREVAWLSGEEYITPKLLAFLRDFGALLRTMRVQSDIEDAAHNPRGSLINPASELYTPYIKALFPEKQKELAAIFADKLMNTDLEQYKDANGNYSIPDGLFYIAAYLPKVTDEISEELRDRVYIKDRERTDIYDCVTKNKNSRDSYVLKRLTKMGEVWSEYCKKAGWYEKQIGFLNIIGNSYSTMCEYDQALEWKNQQVALCQQYLSEGRMDDENDLATAYMNRGVTYDDMGKYEEALKDYDKCIAIRESLHEAGRLYDENALAKAYMSRGVTYDDMGKYEEALKDYDQCIAIMESLHEAGRLYDENDLATAYMNRGVTYWSTGKYEEALKDYGQCIAIRESLHEAGRLYDDNYLAKAYMNRGNALGDVGKHEEALQDYGECIRIRESLHEAGRLYDENDLASAYMNRGVTYRAVGKYEEALKDYGKCIAIRESLHEAGRLYDWQYDLGSAWLNKGILLATGLHDTDGALEIWNHAIVVLEAEEKLSYNANDTLRRLCAAREILTGK